ncbi:MAG: hypothetical protein HUK40_01665 [Desulfobacter sp.]|nr:hypothetical protein [Desulfobacter sp.]
MMSNYPRMHSAEHLLNQAMVRLFNCSRCFSAHINSKKSKCDYHFERPLTAQEIQRVQDEVNQAIQADYPAGFEIMSSQEAQKQFNIERVPGQAKLSQFRIVRMGDYDACPCIGDHVSSTGQIGAFKITTAGFEAGVVRIRFKLGCPG